MVTQYVYTACVIMANTIFIGAAMVGSTFATLLVNLSNLVVS